MFIIITARDTHSTFDKRVAKRNPSYLKLYVGLQNNKYLSNSTKVCKNRSKIRRGGFCHPRRIVEITPLTLPTSSYPLSRTLTIVFNLTPDRVNNTNETWNHSM